MKLDDIHITALQRFETAGGDVLHAMKQNDVGFAGFGEAYFSWVNPGAVKAWKRHTKMTMNLLVPVGRVRFVFRLDEVSDFRVEEVGIDRYERITVPPGIWFGFQGLAESNSLVLNIASIAHDPNEVERLPLQDFNYGWN